MRNFTQNLAFLLVAALCCFGMQVKANELTVNDGTATNLYVPLYGFYADTSGKSQFVVSSDDLSGVGTISGLKFYAASDFSFTGTWEVRLMETTEESVSSSFLDVTDATLVYSGQIVISNGEASITFTEAFSFVNGENLLVEVKLATTGNCSSSSAPLWYGVSTGTSRGGSGGSPASRDFLPKVTFEYVAGGGVTCEKPSAMLAENVGSKTASLSWADGSGVYNVELKKGTEDWQPLLTGTTDNLKELTDLTPNTAYQARVQSVCDEEVSGWRTVSFSTQIGIPYLEQFNSSSIPTGWSQKSGLVDDVLAGTATLSTGYNWYFGTANGVFNSHARLNIYGSSCKSWLLSPAIALEGNLQLTFDMALTKYSGELGQVDQTQQQDDRFIVLISVDGGTTWSILREWNNTGSEYVYNDIAYTSAGEEAAIDLSAYAGESAIFAFYGESTSDGGDNNFHIDNVLIDYIPRCFKPTSLAAGSVEQNSAEISWNVESGEVAWILQYKKSAESAWQSLEVTENPYLLENLDAYTAYDVRVAAHCDDVDEFGTSAFCNPISFKTVAGIPFVENFDSSMPSDWKQYTGLLDDFDPEENPLTPVTYGWSVGNISGVFAEEPNHLYKEIYGTSCANWLVTPVIAISGNVQLTFDMALTKYTGAAIEEGNQEDDKFVVLCTEDEGASWEELRFWDNNASDQKYDAISTQGQTVRIDLSEYDGKSLRFAFYAESTVSGGDNYLHIDNFKIDEIPACEQPTDVVYSNLSDTAVTFSWAEVEGTTWQYGIIANPADEIVPTDEMFTGSASENSITIDTLRENSPYAFILRQDCGGATSQAVVRRFRSLQHAAELPFEDNFENGNGWLFVNGSLTNAWAYGEAATESGHAIYVSNDGGTTNAYTNNVAVMVYATKLFHIAEAGTYTVSFDWKANGESSCDYLRAAIVPASVELTASTSYPSGFGTSTLPTGWIAIDGGSKLNGSSAWKSQSAEVDLEEGTYNVVFGWRDDTSAGENPPAAIDNFSFSLMACPAPSDLAEDAEQTTTQTIGLTWTEKGSASAWKIRYKKSSEADWTVVADPIAETEYVLSGLDAATTYQIQVAAWCDPEDAEGISAYCDAISVSTLCDVISSFPWSENFNNLTSGIPLCWNNDEGTTTSSSYKWSYYYTGHDGACLRFDSYYNYTDNDNYLATPEINLTKNSTLSFWCKNPFGGDFDVYIEKDGEDRELLLGGLTSISDWTLKEINLSAYTGSQVIIYFYGKSNYENGDAYLYLDDVMIEEIPDCLRPTGLKVVEVGADTATLAWDALENGAWQFAIVEAGVVPTEDDFVSITDTFKIVEGLASSTAYTFYLRRDCQSSVSPAISVSFQTLQTPVAVPFADDFEDGNKWFFINGNLSNAWAYGAAATESGHAIYVSNDGGTTNAYTKNVAVMVYAVKLFSFDQGTYTFQYDWKANGESSYDYLRVALVPADVELASSTSAPSGFGTSTLPTGWIALDGGSKLNQSADWTTFTTAEMAIPAGEYRVVFGWRDDSGDGSNPPAAIDNFSISKVACAKQTALTIDAITATTATLSWTAGDEEQNAWEIAIDTIAGFDPDTLSVLLDAASNPYIFQNLEPETRYYVYVRANCGDEVHSAWSAVANFKTASACETPSNLEASDITSATAIIRWNTYGLEEFNLRYSEDGTNWITVNAVAMPYSIEDLAPNTSYRVQVQATCNTEVWSTAKTFKTACEAWSIESDGDYVEGFETYEGTTYDAVGVAPDCWEAGGTSTKANPHVVSSGSYYYVHEGSKSLNFCASANSYCYAILPPFVEALNGLQISVWAKMESTSAGSLCLGYLSSEDDQIHILKTYESTSTMTLHEDMLDTIPAVATRLVFVWVYSGSSFYSCCIDDVKVSFIPSCFKPTGLAISEIDKRSAKVAWESEATAWQIRINGDNNNIIDVNENPYILENLEPNTQYAVEVRAICADEEESAWSNSISFATLVACPAPTALKAILTPGNGSIATLKWSAGAAEEAWVIEYDTDADFATAIDSAVVDSTIDLTGLVAEQTYYARVKANCGEEDGESVWSAVISFVPTNALEFIVNDGEATNGFIPIHGINVDYGTSVSQFVIPAEDLAGINGDSITQLTFYTSQTTVGWANAEFEVYMSEIEETVVSTTLIPWSAMTQVLSATHLEIANGEMVVELGDWYKYQGGNLLIGFQQTQSGSWGSSSWYGISATGASVGGDETASQQNFLPKMKINYAEGEDGTGPGEGIFNTSINGKAVKFIRNNHVYILINGTVYNVTGQKVEVK